MTGEVMVTNGRQVGKAAALGLGYGGWTLEVIRAGASQAEASAAQEVARRRQRGRLIPAKMLRTAGFKAPFDPYREVRDGLYRWAPPRTTAPEFFELWLTVRPNALRPCFPIAGPPCT